MQPARTFPVSTIVPAAPPREGWVLSEEAAKSLLHQYSEFLDVGKLLVAGPETHEDLVLQFLADRNSNALPVLRKSES